MGPGWLAVLGLQSGAWEREGRGLSGLAKAATSPVQISSPDL